MYDEEYNKQNMNELLEYIKKNQIIPFIGAGMSSPIYPTWKKYLEQIPPSKDEKAVQFVQQKFCYDMPDYEDIAQYLFDRYAVEFIDKTKETFSRKKITPDKINSAVFYIPKLFIGPVITTNLDQTIEWVYQKYNIPLPVGLADETGFLNERLSGFTPCLWKIHGDIDKSDSWVLTSKEYADQYSESSAQFMDLFCSVLQHRRLLFLGSSLRSDKVVDLLRKLYKKNNYIRHYAILPESVKGADLYDEMSRLANLGIKVIWYQNGNYDAFVKVVKELAERSGKSTDVPRMLKSGKKAAEYYAESKEELWEIDSIEGMDELFNLGVSYTLRKGEEKDFLKAADCYRKAAKQGHIESQFRLGRMYEEGIGVKRDNEEAMYWFRKAAEQNDPGSQYELGVMMIKNSKGLEGQILQAAEWLRKAAEQECIPAQCYLGDLYKRGHGVKQDYEKSAYWYRLAERCNLQFANQGDLDSQYNLGYMYKWGCPGIKKNCVKAVEWYRKAAKQGHCNAQYMLGMMYEEGREVEQNYEEATVWYKKAGAQGHMGAILHLDKIYTQGYTVIHASHPLRDTEGWGTKEDQSNVKKWYSEAENNLLDEAQHGSLYAQYELAILYKNTDIIKSVYWFQKAAEHGKVEASRSLAAIYLHGEGVKENYALAVEWYQKAAEQGDAYSMGRLGKIYEEGRYVGQNYEIAKEWYWKAVLQGDGKSIEWLGNMYEKGLGENSNFERAVELYREFAYKGNNFARRRLGYIYENGIGVKRHCGNAAKLYQEAAEHGDRKAQVCLAHMYEEGNGVFKNIQTAIYWYKRAAKDGYAEAGFRLGQLYITGTEVEQNSKKAIKWFRKAAEGLNSNAMAYLGYIYEIGIGVEINYKEAIDWYQKAAKLSNCVAQYCLGLMYERGKGVQQNEQEAAQYFQKAANAGFAEAQIHLSKMYEKRGDYEKAKEWSRKADEQKIDKSMLLE